MDYLNEFLLFCRKGGGRRDDRLDALTLKRRGFIKVFNDLCSEYTSRFKWESKEKTIDTELIEQTILFDGGCGFTEIEFSNRDYSRKQWMNVRILNTNDMSFYRRTKTCEVMDYSGVNYGTRLPSLREDPDSDLANCAIITGKRSQVSDIQNLMWYAKKLGNIEMRINACIRNIRGTSIITCSDEAANDIKRDLQAADEGIPTIIRIRATEFLKVQPELMSTPGCPEELKVLIETYDKTHADFLNSIGIRANNEINKKSGVTPMEIIEGRHNVDILLNRELEAREKGIEECEKIGLKGLKVSLENFENKISEYDETGKLIGGDNDVGEGSRSRPDEGGGTVH